MPVTSFGPVTIWLTLAGKRFKGDPGGENAAGAPHVAVDARNALSAASLSGVTRPGPVLDKEGGEARRSLVPSSLLASSEVSPGQ